MAGKFSFDRLLGSISKMISEEEELSGKQKKSPQQKGHDEEIQNSILVLAAEVIRRDRNYTSATEKFIRDFLTRQFGANGLARRMKAIDGHLDTGTEPFVRIACKELKMLTTHDSRLNIVHFLFGVAAADDFVNAKETRCINRIAGYLGVNDKDFKEIRHTFLQDNNPYKILGIEEEATTEQVRIAYRKMVLKFHPDKRETNVTEEEASLKFREIQRAFETIKKQRGK